MVQQLRRLPSATLPLLLSLAGYVLLAVWIPLPINLDALGGLRQFTPSLWLGGLYGLLVTGLFGLYVWLYGLVRSQRWSPRPWTLFLTAIIIALPTLFAYPYNANDLFRYALRGRITAVYQQNPYQDPPQDFPQDPLLAHAGEWATATSPYGPVWELIAAPVALTTDGQPLLHLLLLKLLGLVFFWLSGLAIWYSARQNKTERLVLWLFNPALLITFGVDGHNDSLMLLWLLVGWAVWVWLSPQRPSVAAVLAFALMFLSPLTKAIGLLPLPFFWLYFLRHQPNWHGRVRIALTTAVVSLGLAFLAFAPFGTPLTLAARLVNEAGAGASFSFGALLLLWWQAQGYPLTVQTVAPLTEGALLLLVLMALWQAWRIWFHQRHPLRSAADITAVYLLTALNFRLWYATWPFPFTLLDETHGRATHWRLHTTLWFLYLSQLSPLITGHLWAYLFDRDQLLSHTIAVPFTFLLPPLLALFSMNKEQ